MQTQTQKLQQKNRIQRQRMLLLKNRAQNGLKRPSPIVSSNGSPNISYTYTNSIRNSSNPLTLQLLKQYQSNKTSSQADQSLDRGADKSIDYNSALFKYFKQESHLTDKDALNNASSVSMQSVGKDDQSNNDLYKDDSLLNKIDQLLKKNQNKSKTGINQVYQQYLQKKSLSNSSGFTNNNSSSYNYSNQFSSTNPKLKSNTASTYIQKLKTIEQEKQTLTIERQQIEQKKKNKKKQSSPIKISQGKSIKKPPLAPTLSSVSAIQRQKKKIQDTMQEIKKQQIYQFHDKDSLILEFSDNQSEPEQRRVINKINTQQKNKNITTTQNKQDKMQKQRKRSLLNEQKIKLMKQLQQIQKQLQWLQKEEQEEYI